MMNHWIWGFQLYEKSEGKTVLRAHLETSQWFWHSLWHRSQNTNSERNTAWSLQFLWRMDSSPRWGLVLRFYCYMSHQALHWSKSGLSLKFFMRESGWWFGTCFIFPFTWECHHPNWRTPSFFWGVAQPPTRNKTWLFGYIWLLPSGKRLHSYGKSPCYQWVNPRKKIGHFP